MKNKIAQLICLIVSVIVQSNTHAAPQTNCQLNEEVFFSCQVGKKILSMCSSPKAETPQYLEYRFGTPKNIELRYRGSVNDVPKKFNRAEITGASNSGITIWFKRNDVHYVINAPVRGGPYLEVIMHGKRVSRFACQDEWGGVDGDLDIASNTIATKTQAEFFSEVLGIVIK